MQVVPKQDLMPIVMAPKIIRTRTMVVVFDTFHTLLLMLRSFVVAIVGNYGSRSLKTNIHKTKQCQKHGQTDAGF